MQKLIDRGVVVAESESFTWSDAVRGWDDGKGNAYADWDRKFSVIDMAAAATQWLIDIGPFFDRFGSAMMAVLTSPDAQVQGLLKSIQVRKWIDLTRPDVVAGLDLLIAKGLIDEAAKLNILNTPVAPAENLALRKMYFS